jgi:hypothetical protein
MQFIKGHITKPARTTLTGQVIYTNGTDECLPNEPSCVAYGYTWDKISNTCRAYRPDELGTVMKTTLTVGNRTEGVNNEVKRGSFYNTVNGTENTIGEGVQNSTVSGRGNEIENDKDNASVSGSFAKVQRQSEIALGGGNYGQLDNFNGYAQSSTIHCIARTAGAGAVEAPVAGVVGGLIDVQSHSVIVFKITGIAVKEAGGAYYAFEQNISVQMANDSQATICLGTVGLLCPTVMPEEWLYPYFSQTGDAETGWGGLRLMVTGLPEVDLMYNIKLELLETRNLTNY